KFLSIFREAEMFRSETVDEFASLVYRFRQKDGPGIPCRAVGHASWQLCKLFVDILLNLRSQATRSCNKQACGILSVFRLSQKVSGDPLRVSVFRKNHRLRRACGQVDRALVAYKLLSGGHVPVPRTKNLVHPGHTICAISQRGDGLCSADSRDSLDAKNSRCRKQLSIRLRANNHDLRHAGNFCRNKGHDQRRDKREAATRNVAADRFDGPDHLMDFHAWRWLNGPGTGKLFFGHASNILCSFLDGLSKLC